MFKIYLYHMSTENNRMDKTNYLTQIAELNGELREATSVINPSITFQIKNDMQDLENGVLDCNYIYIPNFKRYYFVDNIVCVTNTLWEIDCSVDVLMSFKDQLGELDVACVRNEYNHNNFIPDGEQPSTIEPHIDFIERHIDFNDHHYATFIKFDDNYTPYDRADKYCILMHALDITKFEFVENVNGSLIRYYPVTNQTPMSRTYILNTDNFQKMCDTLLNADFTDNKTLFNINNPSENIVSFYLLPIDLTLLTTQLDDYETLTLVDVDHFYCGNKQIKGSGAYNFTLKLVAKSKPIQLLIGVFNLTDMGSSFIDYSAYTNICAYIPYYGFLELPVDLIVGKWVYVYYVFDLLSNTGMILVKRNNTKVSLDQEICSTGEFMTSVDNIVLMQDVTIGFEIPVGQTNASARANNFLLGALKTVVGVGLTAATGGLAAGSLMAGISDFENTAPRTKKGNLTKKSQASLRKMEVDTETSVRKIVGDSLIGSVNIIANSTIDIIKSMQPSAIMSGSIDNKYSQTFFQSKCYLRIQRPKNLLIDVDNSVPDIYNYNRIYNHLIGKPSNYYGKLNLLKGFTVLGGFHLEGIKNCTSTEQEAINGILRSGFLMPDPE